MALAITMKDFGISGNKRRHIAEIAFDSSYPTGGESLVPNDLGLMLIDHVSVFPKNGYFFEYDYTNKKVKVFLPTNPPAHTHTITIAGGEAGTVATGISSDADAAALSKTAATARTGITGIQATTPADAVGAEVADTTDLSALTAVRLEAIGA